jgi:hypothetical protein
MNTPGPSSNTGTDIPVGGDNGAAFNINFNDFAASFLNIVERLRSQVSNPANFDPLPYESRKHFRNSQREFLLGWRAILDDVLHRLDERDIRDEVRRSSEPATNFGGSSHSIKIEVEEIDD